MKTNRQRTNWIIDAVLLCGFLMSFYLDLTGLPLHQWLGIGVGLLATYHLATHWPWVRAVGRRLLGRTTNKTRLYFLVDASLMVGFILILATGLVISTWLSLPLQNYFSWRNAHVASSIATLIIAVCKVAIHWRWIATTAQRHVLAAPL